MASALNLHCLHTQHTYLPPSEKCTSFSIYLIRNHEHIANITYSPSIIYSLGPETKLGIPTLVWGPRGSYLLCPPPPPLFLRHWTTAWAEVCRYIHTYLYIHQSVQSIRFYQPFQRWKPLANPVTLKGRTGSILLTYYSHPITQDLLGGYRRSLRHSI